MPLSWHPFPKTELYFYIFFKRSDFMNYIYPAIFIRRKTENTLSFSQILMILPLTAIILPMLLQWLRRHAGNTCSPI